MQNWNLMHQFQYQFIRISKLQVGNNTESKKEILEFFQINGWRCQAVIFKMQSFEICVHDILLDEQIGGFLPLTDGGIGVS